MFKNLNPFAMVNAQIDEARKSTGQSLKSKVSDEKWHNDCIKHHCAVEDEHETMADKLNKMAAKHLKDGFSDTAAEYKKLADHHMKLRDQHGKRSEKHEDALMKMEK